MKQRALWLGGILSFGFCAWLAFAPTVRTYGWGAFSLALLAAFPAGLAVWIVAAWADRLNPKPRRVRVFVGLWGALVCIAFMSYANGIFNLLVQRVANYLSPGQGGAEALGHVASALISAPLGEELLKGLVVIVLLVKRPRLLLGPSDGIVLGAGVGAAFSVAENLIYFARNSAGPDWWNLVISRSLEGMALHVLCSMAFGAAVGWAALRPTISARVGWIGAGWLVATALHAWSNGLKMFGTMAGQAVFWPVAAGVFGILLLAVHRDWVVVRRALSSSGPQVSFSRLAPQAGRWALWSRWLKTTEPTPEELAWEKELRPRGI